MGQKQRKTQKVEQKDRGTSTEKMRREEALINPLTKQRTRKKKKNWGEKKVTFQN